MGLGEILPITLYAEFFLDSSGTSYSTHGGWVEVKRLGAVVRLVRKKSFLAVITVTRRVPTAYIAPLDDRRKIVYVLVANEQWIAYSPKTTEMISATPLPPTPWHCTPKPWAEVAAAMISSPGAATQRNVARWLWAMSRIDTPV